MALRGPKHYRKSLNTPWIFTKSPQKPPLQKVPRKRKFFDFAAPPEKWGLGGVFWPRAAGHFGFGGRFSPQKHQKSRYKGYTASGGFKNAIFSKIDFGFFSNFMPSELGQGKFSFCPGRARNIKIRKPSKKARKAHFRENRIKGCIPFIPRFFMFWGENRPPKTKCFRSTRYFKLNTTMFNSLNIDNTSNMFEGLILKHSLVKILLKYIQCNTCIGWV